MKKFILYIVAIFLLFGLLKPGSAFAGYNCSNHTCVYVATGGTYSTLNDCQQSTCPYGHAAQIRGGTNCGNSFCDGTDNCTYHSWDLGSTCSPSPYYSHPYSDSCDTNGRASNYCSSLRPWTCNTTTYACFQSVSGTYPKQADCTSACVSPTPSPSPTPSVTPSPSPTPGVTYVCNTNTWVCDPVDNGTGTSASSCSTNCKAPAQDPCRNSSSLKALAPAGIPVGGLCEVNRIVQLGLNLLLIASVVLAIFYLAWGGITWILSEGDKQKLSQARHRITIAIIGLIVIFVSFAILKILQFIFKVGLN